MTAYFKNVRLIGLLGSLDQFFSELSLILRIIGTTSLYILSSPLMLLMSSSHALVPCTCAWSMMAVSRGVTKAAVSPSVNPMIATSSGMRSPFALMASKAA